MSSEGVKIIIGLGNPSKKYGHTRHNVGFRVVEALADGQNFKFDKKLAAEIVQLPPPPSLSKEGAKGEFSKILLAKPQTFMNESGRAVAKLLKYYKVRIADLLIIHDEVDLPFGKLRLSQNSGSAGHRGIESIIAAIGPNFKRLRVGVENRTTPRVPDTEIYVLQNFTPEEEQKLKEKIIPEAIAVIKKFLITNA